MSTKAPTMQPHKQPDDATVIAAWAPSLRVPTGKKSPAWTKSKFTLADWKVLRNRLKNENLQSDWEKAFHVLWVRWYTRYLLPLNSIKKLNANAGEGFSIMTIACCLLDSIADAYYGKVYHYNFDIKAHSAFAPWGYRDSESHYVKMLREHPDFAGAVRAPKFNEERFYRAVRCGLVHEARTKAEVQIKGGRDKDFKEKKGLLLLPEGGSIKINRDEFVQRIGLAIDRLGREVIDPAAKRVSGETRRNCLARHMDWTFGMFDHHEIAAVALKGDLDMPWWLDSSGSGVKDRA